MPPPPTPIHTTTTTTDNTTLHLYTHNAPSPPRPSLILLHYWGGSPTTWTPLLAAHPSLRTANAITYHARGWAPSTGPDPDDPGAYGTAAMSRDLAAVVRAAALDDPHLAPAGFVVVGHSMGAKVAQHYAATAGSGCQGLRGLVLVAPAPLGGLRFPPEVKEQQRSAYEIEMV
ncbi:putative alpha beta [Diplodia seriata]|uniref:Putative alpha beta n=1 Tax=Diplodia seriata TaxID=420778 RepID=A0A0G2FSA5_9PEZI|nr:putative alpha beta [Diplodia seriata]